MAELAVDEDLKPFEPSSSYVFKYAKKVKKTIATKKGTIWPVIKQLLLDNLSRLRVLEKVINGHPAIIPQEKDIILETMHYFFARFINPEINLNLQNQVKVVSRIAELMKKTPDDAKKALNLIAIKWATAYALQNEAAIEAVDKAKFGGFGDYMDYGDYYDRVGGMSKANRIDAYDYYNYYDGQFAGYNDGDYYENYYYGDVGGLDDFYRFGKRERNLYEYGYRRQLQDVGSVNISECGLGLLYEILITLLLFGIIGAVFYRRRRNKCEENDEHKIELIQEKNNEENHV